MTRYRTVRKLYDNKILFEPAPTAWPNVMRHVNGTEHMFNSRKSRFRPPALLQASSSQS